MTAPAQVDAPRATNDLISRNCWCGSEAAFAKGTFDLAGGKQFPLVRCAGCGVYAIFPQPDDDELHSYYSAEYYGSSRQKFIGPFAKVIACFQSHRARMTARYLPPGAKVLDVGCGNGGFLMQMKQRGFVVEGTEWTAESAARVPSDQNIPVHIGDLLSLDLPPCSFDLITMWHVLEHVRDPHMSLLKIAQLLKPGGGLMLAVPNAESRQAQRFGTSWLHFDPPRHLFDFGPASLGMLLENTGYKVSWTSTHSMEQNTFGYIQSWLNSKGWPRDRLFMQLKGLSRERLAVRMADLFWLAALLGPAVVVSWLESLRDCGATLTLLARIKPTA